ncbi:TspO/MBR family protein [Stappia sp.]|uniref:TspO/MBR family protein n=1 Tax=Stappia sp. TaxID=1870903 RepID=UPI003A997FA3
MNRFVWLAAFLVLVVGGGLALGGLTVTGGWYAELAKPAFNPPAWVFAPAWTVLYILIAIAGWRVWLREPTGRVMQLWCLQLVLNFAWTPVFFGAHLVGLALVIILLTLVAILGFVALAWRAHRFAAVLFLPYAAWVAFATLLNVSIVMLN